MGVMQFNIPDDVKEAFEAAFKNADADAVVADLLRKAAAASSFEGDRPSRRLIDLMQEMRTRSPGFTEEQIRRVREEGRP